MPNYQNQPDISRGCTDNMNLFIEVHNTERLPQKLDEVTRLGRLPREFSAEGCRVLVDIDQPHQVVLGTLISIVHRDEMRTMPRIIPTPSIHVVVAQHVELVGHGREEGADADANYAALDQRGNYAPLDLYVAVEQVEQGNLRNCTARKHKCAHSNQSGAQTQDLSQARGSITADFDLNSSLLVRERRAAKANY